MIVVDEIHTCLEYNTMITTNLGTLAIGDIVENSIECSVKSYNEISGNIEYKNIKNFYKVPNNQLIHLEFLDNDDNIISLNCTPDHKIFTKNRGYVKAIDLNKDDDIEFNKN